MLQAPRRALVRAITAGIAAGVSAALLLGGWGSDGWGTSSALAMPLPMDTTQDSEPTAESALDIAELIIAPTEEVLETTAEEIVFSAVIRNVGEEDAPLPGGTLRLELGLDRIESRIQLAAALSTSADSEAIVDGNVENEESRLTIAEVEVEPTAAGEEQALSLAVPRDTLPLFFDTGIYAVRAELRLDEEDEPTAAATSTEHDSGPISDGETLSDGAEVTPEEAGESPVIVASTPVIWGRPIATEQLPVTVIVPFVLPGRVTTMPTQADLAAAAPRLDALLTAAERWDATLAIDPRIIAGVRALGTAAPTAAQDFLARLESTALPSFLLQFADADPAAQADLGFEELLQPLGFTHLTREGTFDAPEEVPDESIETQEDSASDEPASDEPVEPEIPDDTEGITDDDSARTDATPDADPLAPGVDDLVSWAASESTAWPAEGEVNTATLHLLRQSGILSVVLSSDNVTADTYYPRATLAGFDALITDAQLGGDARRALGGSSQTEQLAGSVALTAGLALAAQNSSSGLVIGLDRGAVSDADAPAAFLDELATHPWIRPTLATDLPQGEALLRGGGTSEQREEMLQSAVQVSARIVELAPLLEQPEYLSEYQRMRLLSIFSTRYAASDADLSAVRSAFDDRNAELLEGVQVLPSENAQLVGTRSQVPVLLHNALPFDARITLRASPTNAAIQVPERRFSDRLVAEGANTTVLVPVDSRVSSGESGLTLQVADGDDSAVFASATQRLTLRSSYETIMLIGLSSLALLLLGAGVWRSVLRHRRSPAAASPDATAHTGE